MAALKQECDADDDGCSEEEKSLEPQECGPRAIRHPAKAAPRRETRDPAEGEAGYWHLHSH